MSFNGSRWGGRHKTRRSQVMSDGRVKSENTALEIDLCAMIRSLGYIPRTRDEKGNRLRIRILRDWTDDRYDHEIFLYPDILVIITEDRPSWAGVKVVNGDGWAVHSRTLGQERRDARHDRWYLRAGFAGVIHVSDVWFRNERAKTQLRPQLDEAFKSPNLVVNLT